MGIEITPTNDITTDLLDQLERVLRRRRTNEITFTDADKGYIIRLRIERFKTPQNKGVA